ncbi:hypothetical protein [Argonema antarcticum]|uniref:hypothetical protein n=1 Tax=Argonema antarcticum TaxID=2942763 RepID=UPI00201105D0|nr:hypothetical protein [Argonema antarcticum]MCL1471453.1 hypothetical protein [Argonema antarcticum A004/B2]
MASRKVEKIKVNNIDSQNSFQQLVIPGLEEFLAKLEQNSHPTSNSQSKYSGSRSYEVQ